ncbi:MAG: hypothetical protein WDM81_03655 [Rhizomicrobium sp.]
MFGGNVGGGRGVVELHGVIYFGTARRRPLLAGTGLLHYRSIEGLSERGLYVF